MSERIPLSLPENVVALLQRPTLPIAETAPQAVTVAEAVEATLAHRELAAPLVASEVEVASGNTGTMSRRERFYRSRTGRLVMSGLATLGLASAGVVTEASPAYAANPVYTVVNPDNDGTRSIYDRNSPSWNDSNRKAPDFSYYGDRLELICGTNGEAIGPYNNKRWHYAKNLSRPEAGVTWIPDRYMNTPNKANQPTPGEAECGSAPSGGGNTSNPAPSVKGCYYNMKAPSTNLTFSYSGNHRYLGNAWQAAKNWTDAGTGIRINQTSSSNAYIKFKDIYDKKAAWYARAVIPATVDWQGYMDGGKFKNYNVPSSRPHIPSSVTIEVNRYGMEEYKNKKYNTTGLTDPLRTYTLGHEIGHALGLAHSDNCGISDKTIMHSGGEDVPTISFNKPQQYDRLAVEQLYGLPRQ